MSGASPDSLNIIVKPDSRFDQAATLPHPSTCSSVKRIPLLRHSASPQRHRITHVIFDCDGILIDSAQAYDYAASSTLNDIIKMGPRYESRVFYEQLCGIPPEEFYTYLYDTYVSPPGSPVDEGLKAKEGQASAIKGLDQKAQMSTDDVVPLSPPSLLEPSSQKEEKEKVHRVPTPTKAEFIRIYKEQKALFRELYGMQPIAGVESVLNYLQNVVNVPIALATNSRRDELREKFLESKVTAVQAVRDYFVNPLKGTAPPVWRRGPGCTGERQEALGLRG